MTTKNLLVELLVEELPPKALKKLGEVFGQSFLDALKRYSLLSENSQLTSFASPRRLAAHISAVLKESLPNVQRLKLMPVSVGLDAVGNYTPALWKKLFSLGYSEDTDRSVLSGRITIEPDGKTNSLFHTDIAPGFPLSHRLHDVLTQTIGKLPIPKMMAYQLSDGWETVSFVRPAHKLVILHGDEIVPVANILGLTAGRETQGHRFEASAATLDIRDADSYEAQLENEGAVTPSFAKRRAEIVHQLNDAAAKQGLKPIGDEALLDEVTGLVERPNVLLCQFEAQFLEVPQECLILTMKANQKYFPLLDASGKLTNKFLVVSNINPADASAVIGGNERVVRPRLADAKFFFDQDRKKTLESRVLGLARVVYHNKLGTQGERVQRVCAIARAIGQQLGGDSLAMQAEQAALLAKADLLTDMVGEFPELQGIMGRYYALHDGLPADIADAIEDHYKPRFAGDELPRNQVGLCVALADKLETLVGMFGIGEKPTGDKDPFALRRHALGVIRMLIERELHLNLDSLLGVAIDVFESEEIQIAWSKKMHEVLSAQAETRPQRGITLVATSHGKRNVDEKIEPSIIEFIYDRLAGLLREQGYSAQEVDAVVSLRPQRLGDIPKRLAAVRTFSALPEASALAAANKRVGNILKKAEGDAALRQAQGERHTVNAALLKEPAEQVLQNALSAVAPGAGAAFERGDYTASLQYLAKLKEPVDAFFDQVMVNAEDAALRANRLALLAQLHAAMNRVADISKLAA